MSQNAAAQGTVTFSFILHFTRRGKCGEGNLRTTDTGKEDSSHQTPNRRSQESSLNFRCNFYLLVHHIKGLLYF